MINLMRAAGATSLQDHRAAGHRPSARTPPSNDVAVGLIATAIIILLAFGSLLGIVLPLLVGMMSRFGAATFAIDLLAWSASLDHRCHAGPR